MASGSILGRTRFGADDCNGGATDAETEATADVGASLADATATRGAETFAPAGALVATGADELAPG